MDKFKYCIGFMINNNKMLPFGEMLVESIRNVEDEFSKIVVFILVPSYKEQLKKEVTSKINDRNVIIHEFDLELEFQTFPFYDKAKAAYFAEIKAENFDRLIWVDCDSFFVRSPLPYLSNNKKIKLHYRPVDKVLIGSRICDEIDDFWQEMYTYFDIKQKNIFKMITSVDNEEIRLYFNAGMLVVSPKANILQKWYMKFNSILRSGLFNTFFNTNPLYRIFIHQVILTCVILKSIKIEEMKELNNLINYPLHLHKFYPSSIAPKKFTDIITLRYDTLFNEIDWKNYIELEPKYLNIFTKYEDDLKMIWEYE